MAFNDFQDFLRELKLRTNLVDTIAHYIPVTKKGGRYFCVCPFHSDKNPSMAINEQDGFYHCFACQATGDCIKFVMDYESLDFNEAVRILADKANIPVPEFKSDPKAEEKKERSELLKSIMLDAAKYYRSNLLDETKGKEAREYLNSRGIDDETIKRYGLGLSLDYESLPKYLRYKGYKFSDMKEIGLIAAEDNPFDSFAKRIIVPIVDSMSNVVAFGGRVYHGEDKTEGVAKYKNSTNTPLFNKSYFVYGINFVKKDRKVSGPTKELILVEGYMDVISLGSVGIRNVVAGMGTALTEGQAREMKKICDKIYTCYDDDDAGRHASLTNIDTLKKVGFDVRVISLSNKEDPDETIRNHGKDYFLKKKEEALSVIEYKLKRCEQCYDLSTVDGKANYIKKSTAVLKTIRDDESLLEVYAKIVSDLSGVSIDAIKRTVYSGKMDEIDANKDKNSKVETSKEDTKNIKNARFVLNKIMTKAMYINLSEINKDWLNNKVHKKIFDYASLLPSGDDFNVGLMFDTIPLNEEITMILDENMTFESYTAEKEYYYGCLITLANDYISKKIEEETDKLKKSKDRDEQRMIQIEIQTLQRKKKSREIKDKI